VPEESRETNARYRVQPSASLASNFLGVIMFSLLLTRIHHWFERAEQRRNDEYLASARDLAELERRMRSLERCC
jgi:hypothetical protein